jgi:hypothetical protein
MSRIVVITAKLFLSRIKDKNPQSHDNEATIMIKYSMKPHHFLLLFTPTVASGADIAVLAYLRAEISSNTVTSRDEVLM